MFSICSNFQFYLDSDTGDCYRQHPPDICYTLNLCYSSSGTCFLYNEIDRHVDSSDLCSVLLYCHSNQKNDTCKSHDGDAPQRRNTSPGIPPNIYDLKSMVELETKCRVVILGGWGLKSCIFKEILVGVV